MAASASPSLSTTGYAILGLLSLRSWTGYELTQQAQRSLRFCWPKATTVLYDEPRRLVARGLATVAQESNGQRARNRYAITPAGRKELRRWLGEPPEPPRLEFEPMLRMIFVDQVGTDEALATVHALREWVVEERRRGLEILASYRDGSDVFPARRHLNVLNTAFYAAVQEAALQWTELAEQELSRWHSTSQPGDGDRTTDLLDELWQRYGASHAPSPPAESTKRAR